MQKVLVDPMRRAILDLLRQKPMTQAGLANELGLTGASLNHHMKILRSSRLVTKSKREIERHRIMQIFLSSIAYLFVYDLDSLPKNITRYFYPVSLERARAVVSLLSMYSNELSSAYEIEHISDAINMISAKLSRHLITSAKSYENRTHGLGAETPAKNPYVAEMYKLALEGKLKFLHTYILKFLDCSLHVGYIVRETGVKTVIFGD